MNKIKKWLSYTRRKNDEFYKIDIKSYWKWRIVDTITFTIFCTICVICVTFSTILLAYFGLF